MTEYRILKERDELCLAQKLNKLGEQGYKLTNFSCNKLFLFAVVVREEEEL